jgi:lipid-binding SYLF domain-containing protein
LSRPRTTLERAPARRATWPLALSILSTTIAIRHVDCNAGQKEELMLRTVARLALVAAALVAGCASTPKTQAKRMELERSAAQAKEAMITKDPTIRPLLRQSAGYIVFPVVKEGGFIVGGASADGVVYERGQPVGYAQLSRASFGAQIGGQKYAELVAVRDKFTLDRMKAGNVDLGGQASAVILRAGTGTATSFGDNGIAVVMNPIGGAMVNASLTGQRIKTTM